MRSSQSQLGRQALIRWWGALLLLSVVLCLVASLRYYAIVQFDASAPALLFRASMLLGHFTVLCAILLSPVLAIAVLWPRQRWVIPIGRRLRIVDRAGCTGRHAGLPAVSLPYQRGRHEPAARRCSARDVHLFRDDVRSGGCDCSCRRSGLGWDLLARVANESRERLRARDSLDQSLRSSSRVSADFTSPISGPMPLRTSRSLNRRLCCRFDMRRRQSGFCAIGVGKSPRAPP